MEKTFKVPDIGCDGCVNAIKDTLKELEGVKKVDGVSSTKMITVEYDDPSLWEAIVTALKEIDYPPEPA